MARSDTRTLLVLFGLVALYILLQSCWWMWLLLKNNERILLLRQQLLDAGITPDPSVHVERHALLMVVGEGSVFLLLVLIALWILFRILRRELALAQQQRNFVMASSHELRTPIAALKLHLQTLQRSGLPADTQQHLIASAQSDLGRLNALAEQVLLAMQLEDRAAPRHVEQVDLALAAHHLITEAQGTYAAHHQVRSVIGDDLTIYTDMVAFRSILANLLENACKYSPKGSEVGVELARSNHLVVLRVSDQGPGIDEADRQRMFNRFFRGGSEATRNTKGTGLGLFIVRRLLQRLGGGIEYRRASPTGSIFIATIPDLE